MAEANQIRANVISPGPIETPMFDAQFSTNALKEQFKVLASAAVGNRVMNERADTLVTRAGKKAEVPAAGFFEIKEGKIFAWRDYFDLQTFTKQME